MPPVMPTLPPPQDFKAIQAAREQSMMRQMAVSKGGGTFVVPQTTNPASNDNIVNTAKLMTRMDKVTQAQTKGGKRKKKNKRKKSTRKYIRLQYVYIKPNT